MNFSLDFNQTFDGFKQIQDGEYEVIISRVNENATQSGAEYVEFDLIIRNDFNQEFKNFHIFHKVWRSKADGKYNMKQFNTVGKACKLQQGKSYASFNELLEDFRHKTALVMVKNETSEYNGKTYENLNVKYWNESKLNGCNHVFENKNETSGGIDISDQDLPF